jgi:hypothetical protein
VDRPTRTGAAAFVDTDRVGDVDCTPAPQLRAPVEVDVLEEREQVGVEHLATRRPPPRGRQVERDVVEHGAAVDRAGATDAEHLPHRGPLAGGWRVPRATLVTVAEQAGPGRDVTGGVDHRRRAGSGGTAQQGRLDRADVRVVREHGDAALQQVGPHLDVGVDGRHHGRVGLPQRLVHGCGVPDVGRVADQPHAWVLRGERGHERRSVIGRGVVDHDDLEGHVPGREQRPEAARQVLGGVEGHHDRGHAWRHAGVVPVGGHLRRRRHARSGWGRSRTRSRAAAPAPPTPTSTRPGRRDPSRPAPAGPRNRGHGARAPTGSEPMRR